MSNFRVTLELFTRLSFRYRLLAHLKNVLRGVLYSEAISGHLKSADLQLYIWLVSKTRISWITSRTIIQCSYKMFPYNHGTCHLPEMAKINTKHYGSTHPSLPGWELIAYRQGRPSLDWSGRTVSLECSSTADSKPMNFVGRRTEADDPHFTRSLKFKPRTLR